MPILRRIIPICAFALLLGCQSTIKENMSEVKLGMDKHQVLHILGSPDITRRWEDKDRWIYRDVHEVHFEKGSVVYKGDPPQPEVTAEEQDRSNAEENAQLEAKWEQQREDRRHLYDEFEAEVKEAAKAKKGSIE